MLWFLQSHGLPHLTDCPIHSQDRLSEQASDARVTGCRDMPAADENSKRLRRGWAAARSKMPEKYKGSDLKFLAADGQVVKRRDAIIITGTVKETSFHQGSILNCLLMARTIEKKNSRGFLV
jgi:hypothetical protein